MEDSESDEDDYLPLATKIQATESKGENPGTNIKGERQGTSSGGQQTEPITFRPSTYETATEYTLPREAEIETNRRKHDTTEENRKETERDETVTQDKSEIPQAGSKKRGRKERLVSYSSQVSASSLDQTSSRRS